MNELALFAGAGGGLLASKLLGWNTVCAVEIERYPREVLLQRQRDGMLDRFPIWDDVRTFDGKPWKGIVDVISGGFPCQDISAAGKGAGITGERSGLWKEYARIIGEVRPRFVFAENSPLLRTRGLSVVLKDLAELGYDAQWGVLGAWHVGANHRRNRMWVVANAGSKRTGDVSVKACGQRWAEAEALQPASLRFRNWENVPEGTDAVCSDVAYAAGSDVTEVQSETWDPQWAQKQPRGSCGSNGRIVPWWESEPNVGRVANGVASRVDRLKAIGNGQVPLVAATAFRVLSGLE